MEVVHPICAGLDVHKETVVACVRHMSGGKVKTEVRTFATTTGALLELSAWLGAGQVTHIAMEATGVYWKPELKNFRFGPFSADCLARTFKPFERDLGLRPGVLLF